MSEIKRAPVDCDAGRALGCKTFCCRLLVRLEPGERDPGQPDNPNKRFVDKDRETGVCVHLDPDTHRCREWQRVPRWCAEYDCNTDRRLQTVLRHGFVSLLDLGRPVYREQEPIRVPMRTEEDGDG